MQNEQFKPELIEARAFLDSSPLTSEEWEALSRLVKSDGWATFKKYISRGAEYFESVLRRRTASIEDIRYAQGRLDSSDAWVRDLTHKFINDRRREIAEATEVVEEASQEW